MQDVRFQKEYHRYLKIFLIFLIVLLLFIKFYRFKLEWENLGVLSSLNGEVNILLSLNLKDLKRLEKHPICYINQDKITYEIIYDNQMSKESSTYQVVLKTNYQDELTLNRPVLLRFVGEKTTILRMLGENFLMR